jgi:hypothetical protein
MPSLYIQGIGPDRYTVTDSTGAGRQAKTAQLRVLTWDELCAYILKETPFPPRIFPTLKAQLETGVLCPLNFPTASAEDEEEQES